MSWLSKEDKTELTKQGLLFLGNLVKEEIESNKVQKQNFLEAKNNGITIEEYDELYEQYDYYSDLVYNILNDSELGYNFKKTEVYFLDIIKILMFDEEKDYFEQIQSFTKAIDNVEFINSYEEAIQLREKRLDKEFEPLLRDYNIKMQQYNKNMQEYNGRTLSKLWNNKPVEPVKPERRK